LTHYLDVQALPKKNLLLALSQYASSQAEADHLRHLAQPEHKEEYAKYVMQEGRMLWQVLREHPSIRIGGDSATLGECLTIGDIFELLPRLQPRYYSISSSPKVWNYKLSLLIQFIIIIIIIITIK
jgi:NADPH-ferrihemoprotein reductase